MALSVSRWHTRPADESGLSEPFRRIVMAHAVGRRTTMPFVQPMTRAMTLWEPSPLNQAVG